MEVCSGRTLLSILGSEPIYKSDAVLMENNMHNGKCLIYIDWNVIHGVSKGKFVELAKLARLLIEAEAVLIPYTETHVYEASNVAEHVGRREEYIDSNLSAISNITNAYMYEDEKEKSIMIRRDRPVNTFRGFDKVCNYFNPLAIELMEAFGHQQIVDSMRGRGFDPQVLNNYETDMVIAEIDKIYAQNYHCYQHLTTEPITFMELAKRGCAPLAGEPKLVIMSMYAMLDAAGYASDTKSKNMGLSRWFDSFHVYWSVICDYLISDDWRLRKKAQAIYGQLQANTKVVDPESAVSFLAELRVG